MENLETIPTNEKPRDNRPMENREIVFFKTTNNILFKVFDWTSDW